MILGILEKINPFPWINYFSEQSRLFIILHQVFCEYYFNKTGKLTSYAQAIKRVIGDNNFSDDTVRKVIRGFKLVDNSESFYQDMYRYLVSRRPWLEVEFDENLHNRGRVL